MEISASSAHDIVTEISSILGQNVNLMDAAGTIIASTDPTRVGTFHGGAAAIIAEELPELVVHVDDEFPGARRGLNLPVRVDGVTQGVIGVTGSYDDVITFGHVLQKMTEILVRENRDKQAREVQVRIRERFLAEWILEGTPLTEAFLERGQRLGIDAGRRYWVAAGQVEGVDGGRHPVDQRVIDRANRLVRDRLESMPGGVFARTPNRLICLFPAEAVSVDDVAEFLRGADHELGRSVGVRLVSGVGDETGDVRRGFLQADKALQVAARRRERLLRYGEIALELILDEIAPEAREAFLARAFRGVPTDQVAAWAHVLEVYYAREGSIQEAAADLFMHKNTLGARLDRLHALTGLNPRSRSDGVLFQLATQLLRR